jgi:hypothetical protein
MDDEWQLQLNESGGVGFAVRLGVIVALTDAATSRS